MNSIFVLNVLNQDKVSLKFDNMMILLFLCK